MLKSDQGVMFGLELDATIPSVPVYNPHQVRTYMPRHLSISGFSGWLEIREQVSNDKTQTVCYGRSTSSKT